MERSGHLRCHTQVLALSRVAWGGGPSVHHVISQFHLLQCSQQESDSVGSRSGKRKEPYKGAVQGKCRCSLVSQGMWAQITPHSLASLGTEE